MIHGPALTLDLSDEDVEEVLLSDVVACPDPDCENHDTARVLVNIVQDSAEVTGLVLSEDALLKLIAAGHTWAAANVPGKLLVALDSAATG